jgi:primosomal replication protein N
VQKNLVALSANPPERFDCNQVELVGFVTKIWARSTGDIFTRLTIGEDSGDEKDQPASDAVDAHLTLLLQGGQVKGKDISLIKGDVVQVNGYLHDMAQWETLADFLLKARQMSLMERIPELSKAMDACVKRILTCVIPDSLEVLVSGTTQVNLRCLARLEGVVAKVWEYGGHLFARLAVYDQHTLTTNMPGNNGRLRRTPHYVTVQFTNGQVDGRAVHLKPKDRIRVTGTLGNRVYSENLRTFLISAHKADALANLSDGQAPDDVWTVYVQTCLVAQKMIQYTRRS